jgi:uncharacterized membrane protein YhiD involved in acid resistance
LPGEAQAILKGENEMGKIDLFDYIRNTSDLMNVSTIITNMLATLLVALFIYWVYKKTYTGVMYSMNFNLTILLTSMVTAMVMMVIGTNLALSLGMVGALSIIRFRSAIKDPRDIGFLFWGIAAGLSAGTGSIVIAIIGSLIIALLLFVFKKKSHEAFPYLLVIKGGQIDAAEIRRIVNENTENHSLRMRNSNRQTGTEIIYEIKFHDENTEQQEDNIIQLIQKLDNVNIVNVVYYRGEIPG